MKENKLRVKKPTTAEKQWAHEYEYSHFSKQTLLMSSRAIVPFNQHLIESFASLIWWFPEENSIPSHCVSADARCYLPFCLFSRTTTPFMQRSSLFTAFILLTPTQKLEDEDEAMLIKVTTVTSSSKQTSLFAIFAFHHREIAKLRNFTFRFLFGCNDLWEVKHEKNQIIHKYFTSHHDF